MLLTEQDDPSSSTKTINTFITLPGQVHFRLLCHRDTAGGVIGHSGNIVKHIEFETGATIRISMSTHCIERVISVIGYSTINKRIRLHGCGEECEVSQAQEALIRVFERVLEVEGTSVGVIGCRLLEVVGNVGAIMGRGGKVIDKIRKSTGAQIRVLPEEILPECALPADELIQIMGSIVAVKKALVAITQRLQYKRQWVEQAEFSNSADYSSHVHKISSNIEKRLKPDEENSRRKVEFRLLCPVMTVGGVIGKSAFFVKSLENETSARIRLTTSVGWANERVAMISALETPQPLYSAAQIATVRVLDRCVEIGEEMGIYKRDAVSARLLVSPTDVACLDGVKVASDISRVSGADIQLLAGKHTLHCAAEFDKVLQITGAYENVKSALFQLIGRLRNNMFSSIDPHVLDPRHQYTSDKEMTHVPELDNLGFSGNDDSRCPPKLLHLQNFARKI